MCMTTALNYASHMRQITQQWVTHRNTYSLLFRARKYGHTLSTRRLAERTARIAWEL
jgi:hypothetical protein